MKRIGRKFAPALVASVLTMASVSPAAAADMGEVTAQAGLGVATVLANVVYMPAKIVYATLGTVTGGLAWAVTAGNREVSDPIFEASLGGDYVVGSEVITGEKALYFTGVGPAADTSVAADGGSEVGSGDFAVTDSGAEVDAGSAMY